ncbi:MAG TPA: hypothetical protein VGM86_13530 [Thermoanaerobaculia bacterium]|jgi:hypothetical protein
MTTDSIRHSSSSFEAPAAVGFLRTLGLVLGAVGLLGSIAGFFLARDYFFRAGLVGCVFWVGISLGCLAISMLGHLSGGDWQVVIRRVLEASARVLPVPLAFLFVLLLSGGMSTLYEWSHPEVMQADPVLKLKQAYLNPTAFYGRLALYSVIWIGLAYWLSHLSRRQDQTQDLSLISRMKMISAPGLIIYVLSLTFASVDWLMSLQPHWFSTIFGFYLVASQGLAGFAFLIVIAVLLSRSGTMEGIYQPRHFHDWGKLLFAFVMIWMYFSYSQWLITWAGNLPEEISFFLARIRGGFGLVTLLIVLFHFVVPFSLLLSRDLKRNSRSLILVAGGLLAMRWVELFWQVEPAFHEKHAGSYWLYVAVPLLIGGVWLFFFAKALSSRPLLPIHDPYLAEAIAHGPHH